MYHNPVCNKYDNDDNGPGHNRGSNNINRVFWNGHHSGDNSLTPGPTQAMPKGNDVFVQVNQKDPIDRSITVIYNGGAGMNSVTGCTVRLIRSDGTEETKPLTTQTGSELVFKGTRNPDRIIVKVTTTTGQTYTIVDQMSALAPR